MVLHLSGDNLPEQSEAFSRFTPMPIRTYTYFSMTTERARWKPGPQGRITK